MARNSEQISADDFAVLARHAGIELPAAELDELRYGYNHLLKWINALRRDWRFEDESAHRFVAPEAHRVIAPEAHRIIAPEADE